MKIDPGLLFCLGVVALLSFAITLGFRDIATYIFLLLQ